MDKYPWGGFEINLDNPLEGIDDTSWTKLNSIYQYLEAGEPIPFELSIWLGTAIRDCNQDPDEFLVLLSLKNKKGGQKTVTDGDAFRIWLKYCELRTKKVDPLNKEDKPVEKEAAIAQILEESQTEEGEETLMRSTVQRIINSYEKIERESTICVEVSRIIDELAKQIMEQSEKTGENITQFIEQVVAKHDPYIDKVLKDANFGPRHADDIRQAIKQMKSKASAHE